MTDNIPLDDLVALIAQPETPTAAKPAQVKNKSPWDYELTYHYPVGGPVRLTAETRCALIMVNGKKCGCPANHAIYGKARCVIHAIRDLNDLLIEVKNERS